MKEYRCTRNAPYSHNCLGHEDLTIRQGHYLHAGSAEEAWQQMAITYPKETEAGFTVQEWESPKGGVVVLRVERDQDGNEILINQEGKIAKLNEKGDVIGYEDDLE